MDGQGVAEVSDIYVSRNLHVSATVFDDSKPVCIAFASGGNPRESTAASLAGKYGINTISVACRAMDWWQYADLEAAEAAIARFARRFPRRILYGFSMGGYGALLCSARLEADTVLVCSPQAAMGPDCPPSETRWADDRARIAAELGFPHDNLSERLSRTAEIIVVYDPLDVDRDHVAMVEAVRPVTRIVFPLAGHATLPIMARMGLSSRLVRAVVEGSFRREAFQAELHRVRRETGRIEWLIAQMEYRGRAIGPGLIAKLTAHPGPVDRARLRTAAFAANRMGDADLLAGVYHRLLADNGYWTQAGFLKDLDLFAPVLARSSGVGKILQRFESKIASVSKNARAPSVSYRLAIATVLRAQGDEEGALGKVLEAGSILSAWDVENRQVADVLLAFGREDLAKRYQARAALLEAADFANYEKRARVPEREGNWQQAADIWAEAASAGVEPIRVALRHARALSRLQHPAEALQALAPALEAGHVSAATRKLQGVCALELGRYDVAVEAYAAAAALEPHDGAVQRALSNALLSVGRVGEAAVHARIAAEIAASPGNQRHVERIDALLRARAAEERSIAPG